MDSDSYFQEHFKVKSDDDENPTKPHDEEQVESLPFGLESSDDDKFFNVGSFLPSDVSDNENAEFEENKASPDVECDRDELIDEIFGEDDVDEFEGFNQVEEHKITDKVEKESQRELGEEMTDFDTMMKVFKKQKTPKRRRKKNEDIINDNDEYISIIVNDMINASHADREANKERRPGISKLQMLPYLVSQLQKKHLQTAFIEGGFLSSLAEWLTPLPDGSLPTLQIRNQLIPILENFPLPDIEILKISRIGKSIMYLYRSSKETKENRILCKKIMDSWCRPLFNLSTDYNSMDREERRHQDMLHARAKRRRSNDSPNDKSTRKIVSKPTEQVFARARPPTLSTKDYINRPVSNLPGDHIKDKKLKATMTVNQRLNRLRQSKEKPKGRGSDNSLSITKI